MIKFEMKSLCYLYYKPKFLKFMLCGIPVITISVYILNTSSSETTVISDIWYFHDGNF